MQNPQQTKQKNHSPSPMPSLCPPLPRYKLQFKYRSNIRLSRQLFPREPLLSIGSKHTYKSNILGKCCILNYEVRSCSL